MRTTVVSRFLIVLNTLVAKTKIVIVMFSAEFIKFEGFLA